MHNEPNNKGAHHPAEQVSGRGTNKHSDTATPAGEKRQAERGEGEQNHHRGGATPRTENNAGEHHAEGLGGDGYSAEH